MTPRQLVESRLEAAGLKGSGSTWQCPAHEDGKPSLSVSEGPDGRVLLRCHAGCDVTAITQALGLELRDLFPGHHDSAQHSGQSGATTISQRTVYEVRDTAGQLVAEHVREDLAGGGKRFSWRRDGRPTLSGMRAAELPLYGSERIGSFDAACPVFVVEGEKAAESLLRIGAQAVGTVTGAGGAPGTGALEVLRGRDVVLWPDADAAGARHMQRVAGALADVAASVRIFAPADGLPPGGDAAEWTAERLEEKEPAAVLATLLAAVERVAVPAQPKAPLGELNPEGKPYPRAIPMSDLLAMNLPSRCWIVEGLLQDRDIAMVHAWRGTGKTHFTYGLAHAAASGGRFLRYIVPTPIPVLVVDGEMPAQLIQERCREIERNAARPKQAPYDVLAVDMLEAPLPSLATPAGQRIVEGNIAEIANEHGQCLLILDSVSTLCGNPVGENEAASWDAMQEWLLKLRRQRVSTLFCHHDSKGGAQRGTSKREDIVSQSLHLTRPADYVESQGARFEVRYSKARGIFGAAAQPYEAWLQMDENGGQEWTMQDVGEEDKRKQARELAAAGKPVRAIAEELHVGKSTVQRWVKGTVPCPTR
jgi:hypothetical protein